MKPAYTVLAALFLLIAIVLFGPALWDIQSAIVGLETSEQISGAWVNQWAARTMVRDLKFPLTVENVVYPEGTLLYPLSVVTALISAPFQGLFNAPGVFNIALLLNVALAFVGAWLLFRQLAGGDPWSAFPGAVMFALSPYFVDCLTNGPIESTALGWIPLTLWVVERFPGSGWRPALLRGLMVGYAFAANPYYGIFTALMTAYLLLNRPGVATFWRRCRRVAATALVSSFLILPLAWALNFTITHPRTMTPGWKARSQTGFIEYYLKDAGARDIASMILPTRANDPQLLIHGAYLGLSALLACGLAVAWVRGARRWLWPGLASLVLALGGSLRLGGELVKWGGDAIPLPARWLHQYVPPFNFITHPYRVHPIIVLTMGAMITLLLARRVPPRRRKVVSMALSAVIGLDLVFLFGSITPLPRTPYKVPPFYQKLAKQPDNFGVVDVPPTVSDYIMGRYLLYQLTHGKRFPYNLDFGHLGPGASVDVLGFLGALNLDPNKEPCEPRSWEQEARIFRCKITCEGATGLGDMGYRYLVLHRTGHAPLDQKLKACVQYCLPKPMHQDEQVTVYKLPCKSEPCSVKE